VSIRCPLWPTSLESLYPCHASRVEIAARSRYRRVVAVLAEQTNSRLRLLLGVDVKLLAGADARSGDVQIRYKLYRQTSPIPVARTLAAFYRTPCSPSGIRVYPRPWRSFEIKSCGTKLIVSYLVDGSSNAAHRQNSIKRTKLGNQLIRHSRLSVRVPRTVSDQRVFQSR